MGMRVSDPLLKSGEKKGTLIGEEEWKGRWLGVEETNSGFFQRLCSGMGRVQGTEADVHAAG